MTLVLSTAHRSNRVWNDSTGIGNGGRCCLWTVPLTLSTQHLNYGAVVAVVLADAAVAVSKQIRSQRWIHAIRTIPNNGWMPTYNRAGGPNYVLLS